MRFYPTSVSRTSFNLLLALVTAVTLLALPVAANAEYLIPDGNSAVTQYTEGIPTGGGEKDAKGAGGTQVEPAQTIGARTAARLEQQGPEGRAAAEVAAETAPPTAVPAESDGGDKQKQAKQSKGDGGGPEEATGSGAPRGGGPGGSSGSGEIVAAATGGSDRGLGLLLPLAIVATLIWGVAHPWRRRELDGTATTLP
jgi:hypothetical protein